MNAVVRSFTASTLEATSEVLRNSTQWPDTATGFAHRICAQAGVDMPAFMRAPLRQTSAIMLRRTPELAAYGYVIANTDKSTQSIWLEAVEHLRGRDIYPADRQSFIFNPIELLGIASGIAAIAQPSDGHSEWFISTIRRGINNDQFRTPVSAMAARVAAISLDRKSLDDVSPPKIDVSTLATSELVLIAGICLAFGQDEKLKLDHLEQTMMLHLLEREVSVNDAAEAITLSVFAQRAIDRSVLQSEQPSPLELILSLFRRFPLFVRALEHRQRGRHVMAVQDEYDVQDLLLPILRLHFDDVRQEECTPSYAGNSSRIDFFLPKERMVVEAKMTRKNLGQKEVVNELLIDCGRYSNVPGVSTLVCLIYDPEGKCNNPQAVENDIQNSGSRLNVKVVVCPQGR